MAETLTLRNRDLFVSDQASADWDEPLPLRTPSGAPIYRDWRLLELCHDGLTIGPCSWAAVERRLAALAAGGLVRLEGGVWRLTARGLRALDRCVASLRSEAQLIGRLTAEVDRA